MTDVAQARAAEKADAIPKPSCIRPRQLGLPQAPGGLPPPVAGRSQPPAVAGPQPPAVARPQPPVTATAATASTANGGPTAAQRPPSRPASRPESRSESRPESRPESRRMIAREALEAVLSGVRLGGWDRQFLGRLVHWDKRSAASVTALLWRARLAGREEAALTPRQLDIMLGALGDAVAYRTSGAAALTCWDCENIPGGRCADHLRDADRARAYAEVAALLSGGNAQADLPRPTDISGYRSRTPVASPVAFAEVPA